jgi:hypothetical protein
MGVGRNSDRPMEDRAAKVRASQPQKTAPKISDTGWDCRSAGSRSYAEMDRIASEKAHVS